jgi:hypothetical protein
MENENNMCNVKATTKGQQNPTSTSKEPNLQQYFYNLWGLKNSYQRQHEKSSRQTPRQLNVA